MLSWAARCVSLAWISALIPERKGMLMSTSGGQKKPRSPRMTRKSWARASIAPAAKVCPWSAATVGTGITRTRASSRWTEPTNGTTSAALSRIQSRSSPSDQVFPVAWVTSAFGPGVLWALCRRGASGAAEAALKRFSPAPRLRTKTSPSRSRLGMSPGLGLAVNPVGEAGAVPVGVAVLRLQGTAALEPEVQVVLPGETDAAERLQRLVVGAPLGVAGVGLGHRHVDGRVVEAPGQRVGGVVDGALGRLHQQEGFGQLVLNRLEGADLATELLTLLGVRDRALEHRIGDANQLGGGGRGGVVEGPGGVAVGIAHARLGVELGGDLEEPSGAVDRLDRRQRQPVLGGGVEFAVLLQDDDVSVGVLDVGRPRQPDADGGVAVGGLGQPLRLLGLGAGFGQQRCPHRGVLKKRLWEQIAPGLLQHQDEVDLVHSSAAVPFGQGQSQHAHLAELFPALRGAARGILPDAPDPRGGAFLLGGGPHPRGDRGPLVRRAAIHLCLAPHPLVVLIP